MTDYTSRLPDDCLALIYNFLTSTNDRNNFSLVSHRWLQIDSETRTFLPLYAHSNLRPLIPPIFTRFTSLTKLVLHYRTYFYYIHDEDIILITSMCPELMRLKLISCDLTDSSMSVFSKNCKKLKQFSCDRCEFSDLGLFELLDNCSQLEVLSVTRLRLPVVDAPVKFRAGLVAKTLKVIKLRDVSSKRLSEPLIIASKNLKRLKLINCGGNWDRSLEMIPDDNCLAEVHLEQLDVTDVGVSSLSKCHDLNALRIVNNMRCTNVGLISVAENCKGLKKLYVNDCDWNEIRFIGNEGLIAFGKHSVNLEELALVGVEATCASLQVIATNCQKLVRLELRRCVTITDAEMMCIADKCVALKTLLIEKCDVSNKGIEAFAFPNMVSIRVSRCEKVTREIKKWLNARTKMIALYTKAVNAITSDGGMQEHVVEVPLTEKHEAFAEPEQPVSTSSSSIDNDGPTSLFNEGS